MAVSLSVTTATASLPVAWRLYLPESWAQDPERRETAGVPEEISFATKPAIASNRFAERWQRESPRHRYWAMRGMETIPGFAKASPD